MVESSQPNGPAEHSTMGDTTPKRVILLAGGRGSRLGGVDKALLRRSPDAESAETDDGELSTLTLLGQWCAALVERGIGGVVVGNPSLEDHLSPLGSSLLTVTQEDPPFSGPAAAVCAGVRALNTEPANMNDAENTPPEQWLLCAVDIAEPAPMLDWMLEAAANAPTAQGYDGLLPHDGQGRAQWLASIVDAEWLTRRVTALPPGAEHGRSLRWLLGDAALRPVNMPYHLGHDIDSPDQAKRFGIQL